MELDLYSLKFVASTGKCLTYVTEKLVKSKWLLQLHESQHLFTKTIKQDFGGEHKWTKHDNTKHNDDNLTNLIQNNASL